MMRVSITEQKTALEKERCVEVIKSVERNHGNVEVHKPAAMGKFHVVCIILISLLILGSGTLGVFVYKLMQKTDAMTTKSDDLEAKIKELQVVIGTTTGNEPADNVLEVRISQLENDRATIQGDIDSLESTLTKLGPDVAANEASIQTHETRLEELEANIQALNTSIKNRESGNELFQANIQALNTSINSLESDNALHKANIQALNISINELELDRDSETNILQSLNSSIAYLRNNATAMEILIHDQNAEILLLKAQNNVTLSSLNAINVSVSEFESEIATNSETVDSLNATLEQLKGNLKSQYDIIVNQSSQITNLEDEVTANHNVMKLVNNSVGMLGANLTALLSSINNQSYRLAELETERALDRAIMGMQNAILMRLEANVTALADAISTIEANNEGLDQLGLYKNETEDLDSRLAFLEESFKGISMIKLSEELRAQGYQSAFAIHISLLGYSSSTGVLIFPATKINIGNHYDTTTGQFTAQYAGIYVFILNLYKKTDAGNVWCWIRINGSGVTYANVPAESEYYSESSGSTVVHLDPGDKVDVGDCTNPSNIDNLTTFIGFLLQADFSG